MPMDFDLQRAAKLDFRQLLTEVAKELGHKDGELLEHDFVTGVLDLQVGARIALLLKDPSLDFPEATASRNDPQSLRDASLALNELLGLKNDFPSTPEEQKPYLEVSEKVKNDGFVEIEKSYPGSTEKLRELFTIKDEPAQEAPTQEESVKDESVKNEPVGAPAEEESAPQQEQGPSLETLLLSAGNVGNVGLASLAESLLGLDPQVKMRALEYQALSFLAGRNGVPSREADGEFVSREKLQEQVKAKLDESGFDLDDVWGLTVRRINTLPLDGVPRLGDILASPSAELIPGTDFHLEQGTVDALVGVQAAGLLVMGAKPILPPRPDLAKDPADVVRLQEALKDFYDGKPIKMADRNRAVQYLEKTIPSLGEKAEQKLAEFKEAHPEPFAKPDDSETIQQKLHRLKSARSKSRTNRSKLAASATAAAIAAAEAAAATDPAKDSMQPEPEAVSAPVPLPPASNPESVDPANDPGNPDIKADEVNTPADLAGNNSAGDTQTPPNPNPNENPESAEKQIGVVEAVGIGAALGLLWRRAANYATAHKDYIMSHKKEVAYGAVIGFVFRAGFIAAAAGVGAASLGVPIAAGAGAGAIVAWKHADWAKKKEGKDYDFAKVVLTGAAFGAVGGCVGTLLANLGVALIPVGTVPKGSGFNVSNWSWPKFSFFGEEAVTTPTTAATTVAATTAAATSSPTTGATCASGTCGAAATVTSTATAATTCPTCPTVVTTCPTCPTTVPTTCPTCPTTVVTTAHTTSPTTVATTVPTTVHTTSPTTVATTVPTTAHTTSPTTAATTAHTTCPTTKPTTCPTTAHTTCPTTAATTAHTTCPTTKPTTCPTTAHTTCPTTKPTTVPTTQHTTVPTTKPTTCPTTAHTTCPPKPTWTPELPCIPTVTWPGWPWSSSSSSSSSSSWSSSTSSSSASVALTVGN